MERNALHGLGSSIVYGPVTSRRYGRTFGVNLLPENQKRCDWNCLYCQLGYTSYGARDDHDDRAEGFPSVEQVAQALEDLRSAEAVDAIVVCGNGEPTLHPDLPRVAEALCAARDRLQPRARLVCLTNGSELWRRDVLGAMRRLDEVAVKLDTGSCELMHRVNLPLKPACVEFQIRAIKRLHGAVVQACLTRGAVDLCAEEAIEAWLSAVERAMPDRVDIYTLSRRAPSGALRPATADELVAIAKRCHERAGCTVRAFDHRAQVYG